MENSKHLFLVVHCKAAVFMGILQKVAAIFLGKIMLLTEQRKLSITLSFTCFRF